MNSKAKRFIGIWSLLFFIFPRIALGFPEPEIDKIFPQNNTPEIQAFFAGERTYEAEPKHYALDQQTMEDLELDKLAMSFMADRPWTPFGLNRIKWLLSHPYEDIEEIRSRQDTIRKLAENPKLLSALNAYFEALREMSPLQWKEKAEGAEFTRNVIRYLDFWQRDYASGKKLKLKTYTELVNAPAFAWVIAAGIFGVATFLGIAVITGNIKSYSIIMGGYPSILAAISQFIASRNDLTKDPTSLELARLTKLLEGSKKLFEQMSGSGISSFQKPAKCTGVCRYINNTILSMAYSNSKSGLLARATGNRSFAQSIARMILSQNKQELAQQIGLISEIEVLTSAANFYVKNKERMIFPSFGKEPKNAYLHIEDGHHPTVATDKNVKSVPNSISFSNDPEVLSNQQQVIKTGVLTGPNTWGKTTLLRTIGVNAILAQIGFPVFARSLTISPSLRIQTLFTGRKDSTKENLSTFKRQANIIADILNRASSGAKILLLADEIATGTSPQERQATEESFLGELHEQFRNVLILLATHGRTSSAPIGVTDKSGFRNLQVTQDHRIIPGISTAYNAGTILGESNVTPSFLDRYHKVHRVICDRILSITPPDNL